MNMLKELTDILLEKSLKVADEPIFELASGKKSNLYIDCRKTTKNARAGGRQGKHHQTQCDFEAILTKQDLLDEYYKRHEKIQG